MAVTLKMIAERVGLSPAAVSQILNRRAVDFSSEETKARVFKVAAELGYRQTFGYKVLRGDHTGTAGILLSEERLLLEEHIQALVLQLIRAFAAIHCSCYVEIISADSVANIRMIHDLLERGVDSFFSIGMPGPVVEEEIRRRGKGVIGFCSDRPDRRIEHDFAPACAEIIRYFFARGKRNFRLICPQDAEVRFNGVRLATPELSERERAAAHYQCFERRRVTTLDDFAQIGYDQTEYLLNHDPKVGAIFYHSDYYALGGLRSLCEHGVEVGTEVLVGGINNIHAIRNNVLPVSSVAHCVEESVEIFMEQRNGTAPFVKVFSPKAIVRESLCSPTHHQNPKEEVL